MNKIKNIIAGDYQVYLGTKQLSLIADKRKQKIVDEGRHKRKKIP